MTETLYLAPPVDAELDEQLTMLRRRVIAGMDAATRVRRRDRWIGATAVAAATAAVVAAGLSATFGPQPASASARALLRTAGIAAIHASDPVVGPGQYLRIQLHEVALGSAQYDGHTIGELEPSTDDRYIPADRDDEWTWLRTYQAPVAYFGPDAAAGWASFGPHHGWDMRADGGRFDGQDWTGDVDVDAIPTEPDGVLSFFQQRYANAKAPAPYRGDEQKDQYVFDEISGALFWGTVPAKTRAAMLDALAKLSDVTVVDAGASIGGRTGVAIGRTDKQNGEQDRIVIDAATGLLIGIQSVLLKDQGPFPAGTVLDSETITTSVVDAVPPRTAQTNAGVR